MSSLIYTKFDKWNILVSGLLGSTLANLFPHGKGKLTYKDGDQILEQYEGDFIAGQYEGSGTLVDRHGEVFEGTFKENKFIKSKHEM